MTNRKEYKFVFSQVMKHEKARGVLHKYLIEVDKSGEIMDFLNAIDEYHAKILDTYSTSASSKNLKENAFQLFQKYAKEIMDTYIGQDAKKQVNLSSNIVKGLNERFVNVEQEYAKLDLGVEKDRARLQMIQYHLFSEAANNVLFALKDNGFRRCIASPMWQQFIDNCCSSKETFSSIESIVSHKGEEYVCYNIDEIKRPDITDNDFAFVREVCAEQDHWERINSDNSAIAIYKSRRLFVLPSKSSERRSKYQKQLDNGLKRLVRPRRFVVELNYHYEHVVGALLSKELRDSSSNFSYSVVEASNADISSFSSFYAALQMKMPFPFANRETTYIASARREIIDNKEACVIIVRPYNDSNLPKKHPRNVRCRLMQCFTIVKLDDTLTKVTLVVFMELGGWLTATLFQNFVYNQQINLTYKYHKDIIRTLEKMKENGFPRPQDTLQLLETYENNNSSRGSHPSIYCSS
jgi:uncharacterized protein (UPF0333 family)